MAFIVFDKFYEDYDSWYDSAAGAYADQVETSCAFGLLNPAANEKVLDIGCGTGHFSLKLARLACQVTGVDIAKNMLMQARQKAKRENLPIEFYQLDAKQLPFADHCFDKVISMAAFEFLDEPQKVFDEMLRVLRPGGTLVIGTIAKGGDWQKLYSSELCKGTAYEYASFLTSEDLIALNHGSYTAVDHCLFVPPLCEETAYTLDNEAALKQAGRTGGFVCVSFTKASSPVK